MRLIDADKLKDAISNYAGMFDDDGKFWVSLTSVLAGIDFAPAVDAAPIVHSRWRLNRDGSGTCQHCKRTRTDVWDMDNWDNYCSHCGAKMDGD